MIDSRLKYLYNQYLNDQCSPAELAELKLLLKQSDNQEELEGVMEDAWYELDETALPALPGDKADRIFQQASVRARHYNHWWMKAAAAILLLASSWGIWHFMQNKQPAGNRFAAGSIPLHAQRFEPGNKATLQLANGSNIVLNDIPTGKAVRMAGIKISKTAAGQVIYEVDQTTGNEASNAINTITTPRGGQHEIVLADGSKVWLNASSSLRFPVAFSKTERTVELSGEAYFEVAKDPSKPFSVNANGTTVAVFGTHFNINAYSDNSFVTATLLEGSVRFKKAGASVLLVPGQQGSVLNNETGIKVSAADMEKVMGWKNGYFVFRDENIVDIMKQVARWYDVDIEFVGDLSEREFGGTVSRYKNITELLDNMQLTKTIHYKIEGKKVLIMK
jgi:transmembrane sensor